MPVPIVDLSGLGLLLLAPAAVICAMKGKWAWFALGFFGFFGNWIVGAIRLAKPDSYWAQHQYAEAEMEEAERRFALPLWRTSPPPEEWFRMKSERPVRRPKRRGGLRHAVLHH